LTIYDLDLRRATTVIFHVRICTVNTSQRLVSGLRIFVGPMGVSAFDASKWVATVLGTMTKLLAIVALGRPRFLIRLDSDL